MTAPVASTITPEQHRAFWLRPERDSRPAHQCRSIHSLGTPSADKSQMSLRRSRAVNGHSGRHWYLRFAASTQLRTCIHTRLSRARLDDLRCYPSAPEPHAPHRLLQLERSPSTPSKLQTLPTCGERTRRPAGARLPCENQTTEVFQPRGCTVMKPLARNPRVSDRSPMRIYPDLFASDTSRRHPPPPTSRRSWSAATVR